VRGLQHASEKVPGIVHRDLKPDNVLVNQSRQAKITDFGLATVAQRVKLDADAMDGADMRQSRFVGSIVGTPAYMPPEQWRGDVEVDFRADVYAVGCILYELLTGRWLYDARTVSDLRTQHLEAPLPALSNELPSDLSLILEGCLAKRRDDRFARLDLLLTDLTRLYEAHSEEPLPKVSAEAFTAVDYSDRGLTFHNLEQHERAIRDYDRAIELDPTFAIAYYNRDASYAALGQHEHAIHDYDRSIELDPYLAQAYSNRGNNYAALGQHERAIRDLDRALEIDPNLALAYSNRGRSYAALGQHERAICDLDHAIELDPNFSGAYSNRGACYAALGQHEHAIRDYDRSIELDPYLAQVYFNKGALLANTRHLQESLPWLEKAYALGYQQAAEIIQQIRQALGLSPLPTQTNPHNPLVWFEAFQRADSFDTMRQTVQQFPILTQMIPTIEQVIQQQIPAELKPQFEQHLAWLRQIMEGRK